jgi:DNA-binding transcriptional LysR family regulator
MIVVPELMNRVRAIAPHVKMITRSIGSPHMLDGLASGELDLAMAFFAKTSETLHRRKLGTDAYVCIAKRGRVKKGELTLQRYLSASHLAIAPAGPAMGSRLDATLKAMGLERDVVYYAAHFSTTAAVVERTDLIATLHRRAAVKLIREFDVEAHPLPPEIGLDALVLSELWHERTHKDKAHRWLRKLVVDSCEAIFRTSPDGG